MKAGDRAPRSVDAYVAGFKPEVRAVLRKMRTTIRKAAPDAEEKISYMMPAFFLEGPLVYFAAFHKHIGFFPTSTGIAKFAKVLVAYKTSKGTVRFPIGKPVPYGLIGRIVKFRVRENKARAAARSRQTSSFKSRIERAYAGNVKRGGIEAKELVREIGKRPARKKS